MRRVYPLLAIGIEMRASPAEVTQLARLFAMTTVL